jgi:nucleoside-diphosphate-sugar epimerase
MTILITGIHGFVGSNLISYLKETHTIYGLDIIAPEKEGVIKTFSWNDIETGRATSLPKSIRPVKPTTQKTKIRGAGICNHYLLRVLQKIRVFVIPFMQDSVKKSFNQVG